MITQTFEMIVTLKWAFCHSLQCPLYCSIFPELKQSNESRWIRCLWLICRIDSNRNYYPKFEMIITKNQCFATACSALIFCSNLLEPEQSKYSPVKLDAYVNCAHH